MTDESYFHDPDLPWMPKLIDIEAFKNQTDIPEKAEYFSQFGWDQIDYGQGEGDYDGPYPHIAERWNILTMRFNQHYGYRMLGIETMEHWQNNLQEKFDAMAPRYELAYTLFDEHSEEIVDDVIDGEKETVSETNQASGTDSSESSSTGKSWDTPDSAINANTSYADAVNKSDGSGSTTYGRLDTHDIERTKLITGKGILNNINETVRNYRDVDTQFINEFDSLFLSVYWY
jgi:hypothetical protein